MKVIAAPLFLLLTAGSALGQCHITRYGIPDFDQRRPNLQDDGSNHCVPTSAINLMGYIANHGRPAALGHSSPNWADQSEFGHVSGRILDMGDLMGTGGLFGGGTDADGAVDGLVDYFDEFNVGQAVVSMYISDEDWQIKPNMMYSWMKLYGLVGMNYGRYYLDGDQWERDGGHAVTLCAMQDACHATESRVAFKDPASDENPNDLYKQSPFKTKWWDISRQGRNYDGDYYYMWGPAGQSGDSDTAIRLIDKFLAIMPLFTLTGNSFSQLAIHQTVLLNNDDSPPSSTISIPNNAGLISAYIDPRTFNPMVISAPVGGIHAKVWDYSRAEGTFTEVLDLPTTPDAFTIDGRGDLLLVISGDLHKYRYRGDGSVVLLQTAKVGMAMQSIAVDDKTDDVYALAAGPRRLLKFPAGDLTAAPYEGTLPANLPLGTQPCIATNPADGKAWLTSEGSESLYQLTPSGAAPGWIISASLNVGAKPTSLQFGDKGQMKFITGGKIREFDLDAGGRYVPTTNPVFDNLPASGFLTLARSRTNFDARIHTGPKWADVILPGAAPDTDPETDDCPADFNLDGFVDGIDYDEFNNLFERGNMNADVNFDGFVDGIDYDDFNNWFEKGC